MGDLVPRIRMNDSLKIRATLHLRNARMIDARKKIGISQKALAESAGVPLRCLARIEKLDYTVFNVQEKARFLSQALQIPVGHILPTNMDGESIDSTIVKTVDVSPGNMIESATVKRLMLPDPSEVMEQEDIHELIPKLMDKLSYRERSIVSLYYGLEGNDTHTLEEIGKKFKVTRQRALSIKLKALWKLRQWAKGTDLEIDFVD